MADGPLPPIEKWDSVSDVRGVVHIVHGLAEHARRYARVAKELNRAGFVVAAHHHRGHGKNITADYPQGHFGDSDGWEGLVDDTWAVSRKLLSDYSGKPLIMFAHSMGSFVGQRVLAEKSNCYSGAVFSGTNGRPTLKEWCLRRIARSQLEKLGPRSPNEELGKMVFDRYNKEFWPPENAWLSRDKVEVIMYNEDPHCGFPLTAQAWVDLLNARDAQQSVEFLARIRHDLPILVMYGTADPVGEKGKGVLRLLRTLQKAGLRNVCSEPYDEARHELLNEENKDDVAADLIGWIDKHIQPPTSSPC